MKSHFLFKDIQTSHGAPEDFVVVRIILVSDPCKGLEGVRRSLSGKLLLRSCNPTSDRGKISRLSLCQIVHDIKISFQKESIQLNQLKMLKLRDPVFSGLRSFFSKRSSPRTQETVRQCSLIYSNLTTLNQKSFSLTNNDMGQQRDNRLVSNSQILTLKQIKDTQHVFNTNMHRPDLIVTGPCLCSNLTC